MYRKYFYFLILLLNPGYLLAWSTLTDSLDLQCMQSNDQINCSYRSLSAEPLKTVSAVSGKTNLNIPRHNELVDTDPIALLFVVDTSDPARQNVIEKNKQHIKMLLTHIKPNFQVGLASFDKTLRINSPIGTSSYLLTKSLDELKAVGKTTELYRNLIKAIEHIARIDASRKAIVLLSDGQAEDKAYFHSDVIKAARENGVIINSIGYPRSVSLSVALQTLRRLSEETGGKYIETSINYDLPDSFLINPFNNITNGGNFTIELDDTFKKSPNKNITLEFSGANTTKKVIIPVYIDQYTETKSADMKQPVSAASVKKQTITTNNPPVQIITRQVETQPINLWLWYGIPAAFIIIIVLILITLFLLWQRQPAEKKSRENGYRPYAYLIAQDETETRFPITRTIWRIGRGKDNELRLDDTSISRRHAEIHRNSNGSFDIVDMNSMNGVYVNNEKVGKVELQEGDLLEIGDVYLKFTQLAPDYSLEESTVMQKTKTPSITH